VEDNACQGASGAINWGHCSEGTAVLGPLDASFGIH
jgi:hypothetical protein